jgi:hypothetical protein
LPDEVADGLVVLLAAPPVCGEGRWDAGALAVPLYRLGADDVPAALEDCEKIGGIDEPGPVVQADTDADMRTVAVAQPAAVSLALLTFMRPPFIPVMQQRLILTAIKI